MNNIKKGYLPYLIGEIACLVTEVMLFFLALCSDSPIAIALSVIAVLTTSIAVRCVYKISQIKKPDTKVTKQGSNIQKCASIVKAEKKISRAAYPLAILSLILLCNPNVGMVDILPDFIACFILASLLKPGLDRAPYFAEARRALIRLGWLNVGKIAGLLLVGYSRMNNAFGNDTSVVLITVFAAAELMLGISATIAVFNALFGLGERTSVNATITQNCKTPVSQLPTLTCVFIGIKAILNAIPSFFLLTRVNDDGIVSTVARGYSFALIGSIIVVLLYGIVWCAKITKYVSGIHSEGIFYQSIYTLSNDDNEARIRAKHSCEKVKTSLTLFFAATVALLDVRFDNVSGIDLLPDFIFGVIAIIAILRLRKNLTLNVTRALPFGAAYVILSGLAYVVESSFLYEHGYSALLGGDTEAIYTSVEISATLELLSLIAFAIVIGRVISDFVYQNTALPPSDERYSRADKDFHRALKLRTGGLVAMIITVGVMRCITVFANGYVRLVLNQQAMATVTSALPWMGALTTAITVVLIIYAYFLISTLKEEMNLKYGIE